MAFHVDHWFGPRFAVVALDSSLGGEKLYRAVDVKLRRPVLLLVSGVARQWELGGDPTLRTARVVAAGEAPKWHVAFAQTPGVSLTEILAQSRDLAGDMPLEAAAYIIAALARTSYALRQHTLVPLSSERVRVGFDGSLTFFAQTSPRYDDDNYIELIIILAPSNARRIVPPEPGLAPEEADEEPDERGNVFRHGVLFHHLLEKQHPFAAPHPLQEWENLQNDRSHPLKRDVPDAVRELILRAIAHEPARRFQNEQLLAEAIEQAVPALHTDGVAALGALASGLFPHLRAQQLDEIEQIEMIDYAELISDAPTLPVDSDVITRNLRPPPAARMRMVFRHGTRSLAADSALVTNKEFVEFLDATQRPDPPSFVGRIPELADEPAVLIGPDDAAAFAAWRNGRLPTEPEWAAMVSVLTVPDVTRVWEWTSTAARTGFVVRGGPWRNRTGAGRVDNRSWEDEPCADVGFRVFYDGPR